MATGALSDRLDGRPVCRPKGCIRAEARGVLSGVLSSAAVDYFGGQGGRPSLGGQFTLSTEEATIYRINLPRTTLTAER